jgi:hypothetical protein
VKCLERQVGKRTSAAPPKGLKAIPGAVGEEERKPVGRSLEECGVGCGLSVRLAIVRMRGALEKRAEKICGKNHGEHLQGPAARKANTEEWLRLAGIPGSANTPPCSLRPHDSIPSSRRCSGKRQPGPWIGFAAQRACPLNAGTAPFAVKSTIMAVIYHSECLSCQIDLFAGGALRNGGCRIHPGPGRLRAGRRDGGQGGEEAAGVAFAGYPPGARSGCESPARPCPGFVGVPHSLTPVPLPAILLLSESRFPYVA